MNEKDKYKNVFSPIRYAGGKTRASKILVNYIPNDIKKIVSPFLGGGSFELYLNKNRNIKIIGYNIFDYLVNFWQVLLNEKDKNKFIKELSTYEPTKEFYYKKRVELLEIYKNSLEVDKIEKATLYYFSHQFSYGPMFLGWPSSVYLKKNTFERILKKLENFNLDKDSFLVRQASFEKILPKHQNDFLYLDPPYFLSEQGKVFKGIYPNTNWAIHHNDFDHKKLAKLLKKHKGGFLLSYNDCPEIREMYKDFEFAFPKWHYSYSQGEVRIGKNRKEQGKTNSKKESHEILIFPKNQK